MKMKDQQPRDASVARHVSANLWKSLRAIMFAAVLMSASCCAPSKRLWFPNPVFADASERVYDTDRNGRADFRVRADETGRFDILVYDDDEDGRDDRLYRLSDYRNNEVPHFIVMFDSIPYAAAARMYHERSWTWFDPPTRVIPPFPTLSGLIFSDYFGAPPLPGMINQYYQRIEGKSRDRLFERVSGEKNPWELRLDYRARYWENGLMFLFPRPWFGAELARAKDRLDGAPDRVCIVYLASTSGMLSQHGEQGLNECLRELERLCVQVLYERRGAVKISVMADHGHNLVAGRRIDVPAMLREAGFNPVSRLKKRGDVVVELDGLINYAGIHTTNPRGAAEALIKHPEIELAIWQEGERIIVRSPAGTACIEHCRSPGDTPPGFRYTHEGEDVFGYAPVIEELGREGKVRSDGFIGADDWFEATAASRWPDCPRRLWEAFHGRAVNTPDLMVTIRDGYFAGLASMEYWITMASTHGGLDETHSTTFLLTMTGRARPAMRTGEVLRTIEPAFSGRAHRR